MILYIAAPYAHPEKSVREHRFRTACRAAALLMQAGVVVFSPLSHSVPISEFLEDDFLKEMTLHEFWMRQDLFLLDRCDELLILGLRDWEQSEGVREELFFALGKNKPITLIEEGDIEKLPKIPKTAKRFLQSNILTEVYNCE